MPVVPRDHGNAIEVHKGAYVAATDPGAVGADKLWVQRTGTAPYAIHVRKADNTAWEAAGGSGLDATALHQGGDAYAAPLVLGTTDDNDISFIRHGVDLFDIFDSGVYSAGPLYAGNGSALTSDNSIEAFNHTSPGVDVSRAIYAHTFLQDSAANVHSHIDGVFGWAAVGSLNGAASHVTALAGLRGQATVGGAGAIGDAIAVYGDAIISLAGGSGPNTPSRAISIYGATQLVGGENYSGYFEGDVFIGGQAEIDPNVTVSGLGLDLRLAVTEASYSGGSSALSAVTQLITGSGTLDGFDSGIFAQVRTHPASALHGPLLSGVMARVEHNGTGTIDKAASLVGSPILSGGSGVITNAISVYGKAQTVGVHNWSGYFEGDVFTGGKVVVALAITGSGSLGLDVDIESTATVGTNAILGEIYSHNTSGTVPDMVGVGGYAFISGDATVGGNSQFGLEGNVGNQGSGVLVNAHSIHADAPGGPGPITNAVALYADAPTSGVHNYSVFAGGDVNTQTVYKVNDVQVVGTQQTHVADVASADAPTQTALYVQADVQAIATLCNELKTKLDAALAVLSTHGLMA